MARRSQYQHCSNLEQCIQELCRLQWNESECPYSTLNTILDIFPSPVDSKFSIWRYGVESWTNLKTNRRLVGKWQGTVIAGCRSYFPCLHLDLVISRLACRACNPTSPHSLRCHWCYYFSRRPPSFNRIVSALLHSIANIYWSSDMWSNWCGSLWQVDSDKVK